MHPADLYQQPLVGDLTRGRRPALARVVGLVRELEDPADRLDPEALAMRSMNLIASAGPGRASAK
jgi:hypothetical protein